MPLEQADPLEAGNHQIELAVVIQVGRKEVVGNVQLLVDHLRNPGISNGIGRDLVRQDAQRRFGKVWRG